MIIMLKFFNIQAHPTPLIFTFQLQYHVILLKNALFVILIH